MLQCKLLLFGHKCEEKRHYLMPPR